MANYYFLGAAKTTASLYGVLKIKSDLRSLFDKLSGRFFDFVPIFKPNGNT